MSIELISILMVTSIFVLLLMGLPMAFSLGVVAVTAALLKFGPIGLTLVASRVYSFMNEYVLVAVPMFILMASLMERSGVARDLFRAMHVWAGGLRGGLAVQTLVVAVVMAAMTGIIGGEIVMLGLVALPQMLRVGYDKRLAIGTICAGGSLGSMIPPSVVLIFYGLTVNISIGDLFVAIVFPGLLLAGIYMVYILVRCHLDPEMGPPAPDEDRALPLVEKLALLKGVILPIAVAAWVLGSIYYGIASVSEAAGMGVVGTLISAAVRRELTLQVLRDSLRQTMNALGKLIWITFGATALIGVYNVLGGITFVKGLVAALPFAPIVIVLIMMLILIVLGFFMDWIGILLLTMPVFVPVIVGLGYSPVWFGVLFCMNMQISYLTPPFGPAAFYLKGVVGDDISLADIYRSLVPFIGLQAIGLAVVLSFPEIALWLPRYVYGG